MKRITIFTFTLFVVCNLFAFPGEINNFGIRIDKRLNDTYYQGSLKYQYLVGGLYQKDDIYGAVFYVDEKENEMWLMCVTTDQIIKDSQLATTSFARYMYNKHGWNLFDTIAGNKLCDNISVFLSNRAWEDNSEHRFVLSTNEPGFILMDDYRGSKGTLYLLFIALQHIRFKTEHRYVINVNPDGTCSKQEMMGLHTGWRKVPLEPKFVSETLYNSLIEKLAIFNIANFFCIFT